MRMRSRRPIGLLALLVLIIVAVAVARVVRGALPARPAAPIAAAPSVPTPTPMELPAAASSDCTWLAVSVDNSPPARPQSGVSEASIVYEFPAEGGITRLLTFFCDGAPEVVGPVRSLRIYMLDLARDYGAVVAHSGQSSSALEVIRRGEDPVINEFWQAKPFHRDRHRQMPHNLYTSVPELRQYVQRPQASPLPHWTTADGPLEQEPMIISIPYAPGYDVQFAYDPKTGTYGRAIAGHPAIDAATGTQMRAAALVVQYVHWWQTFEDNILESRLDLVGSGPISVFTGGGRIDGQWTRPDAHSPTVFTDAAGQPLVLRPGLTWVNIVSSDRVVQVERTRPKWQAQ